MAARHVAGQASPEPGSSPATCARDELHAHGGDVLIRLLPDARRPGLPEIRAEVWVVLGGHLILAGNWDRQDPEPVA